MRRTSGQISAVLLLHDLSKDSLVLTKRAAFLNDHPGEICFPGGHWQREDANLLATAFRELEEELGIEEKRVQLIQSLDPEMTLKGVKIYPWLASISCLEPYSINPAEVERIIWLPFTAVQQIQNYQYKPILWKDKKISTWHFISAEGEVIWGATARIMRQFCLSKM